MMRERFEQLAPRERIMVSACAAVVLIALIWVLAVRPMLDGRAALVDRVASKQTQIANFQELAANTSASSSAGRPAVNTGGSIVVIIDKTTRSRQLAQYLKQNQPNGNTSVRLRFEAAPFDQLMSLLGELQNSYGMQTSNASFDSVGVGLVNSSLTLTRVGG
jgi:general secretion pathway protein M